MSNIVTNVLGKKACQRKLALPLMIFFLSVQPANAHLSKAAQADLKHHEIVCSVQNKNFSLAYQQFKEYDAFGVAMSEPLLLIRAQVSFKENDFDGAKANLEGYMRLAQPGSSNYSAALVLLEQLEARAASQQATMEPQAVVQKCVVESEPQVSRQKYQRKSQKWQLNKKKPKMKFAASQNKKGKAVNTLIQANVLPAMVSIPSGDFQMGGNKHYSEKPVRSVKVDAFKMADSETTQALWQAVMGENPSYFRGSNRPVENVSWDDIQDFLSRLNSATGQQYRLPTEAEWEYAARAGTTTEYHWGDQPSKRKANYNVSDKQETKLVKSYEPNAFGLYDVHGNVWEWVQDCYQGNYIDAFSNSRAREVCDTKPRVLRGGAWSYDAQGIRSASRNRNWREYRSVDFGFRLALSE